MIVKYFIASKNWLVKYKSEIIIGLVLILAQQRVLSFGESILNWALRVSDVFSNVYYILIAEDDPYAFGKATNLLLLYFFLFFMGFNYAVVFNARNDVKRKLAKIGIEKEEEHTLEDSIVKLETQLKKWNSRVFMIIILTIFVMVMLFSNYVFNTSIANANLEFRNELIRLEPYVNEIEIKKLKSSWAEMRSKSDHDKVVAQLEALKKAVVK